MKLILRILVIVAVGAGGWLIVRLTGLDAYLSFDQLVAQRDRLLQLAAQNRVLFAVAFVLADYAIISLSVPGATIFTLAAGLLFGPIFGAVLVNIAATFGAFTVFMLTRHVLGTRIQERYQQQLESFNAAFTRDGANYLLSLRLIPVFPFFLINILAALTVVRPRTFLWTTSVGIVAGSLVYAYAGSSLGSISGVDGIFSLPVIVAFSLLGLFSLVPVVYRRIKRQREVANG